MDAITYPCFNPDAGLSNLLSIKSPQYLMKKSLLSFLIHICVVRFYMYRENRNIQNNYVGKF